MTDSDRLRDARGMSVFELLMALAVMGLASGIAMASVERNVSTTREAGAARAFAMRVRQVRLDAIQRSAGVALQFVVTSSAAPSFRAYVDGNGNGIRTREIASGIDPPVGPMAELDDGLGGVRFARADDVPVVADDDEGAGPGGGAAGAAGAAGGGAGAGAGAGAGSAGSGSGAGGGADGGSADPADAIRVGAAGLLSFASTGSGTSGTIYLRGATRQFAVRVYGPTGRVRLLEFDRGTRLWVER